MWERNSLCWVSWVTAGTSTRSSINAILAQQNGLISSMLSSYTALGLTQSCFRQLSEQDCGSGVVLLVGAIHVVHGDEPGWGALRKQ